MYASRYTGVFVLCLVFMIVVCVGASNDGRASLVEGAPATEVDVRGHAPFARRHSRSNDVWCVAEEAAFVVDPAREAVVPRVRGGGFNVDALGVGVSFSGALANWASLGNCSARERVGTASTVRRGTSVGRAVKKVSGGLGSRITGGGLFFIETETAVASVEIRPVSRSTTSKSSRSFRSFDG